MTGIRARILGVVARLLLVGVSITLVLAVFEVGLRMAGHQPIYEIYSKPWIFWQYDPLLGWSHQPGSTGQYIGPRPWPIEFSAEVSINQHGLRGPEIPPRAVDELRVLFLGDSIVAAFEVDYEETFEALVEESLRERFDRPVRVINAGVRGYGSDQSYLYYKDRGRALEPDLVVIFHSRNDPIDNTTVHEMRRPYGKPALALGANGTLELLGHPVPEYPICSEYQLSKSYQIERLESALSRCMCRAQLALFDRSALFSLLTISIPWDATMLRTLYHFGNPHANKIGTAGGAAPEESFSTKLGNRILLELSRSVEEDGADLIVIGRPIDLEKVDLDRISDEGITIVSLDEIGEMPRIEVSWKHDSHFNPHGHRLIADRILPTIERALRERLSESATRSSSEDEAEVEPPNPTSAIGESAIIQDR